MLSRITRLKYDFNSDIRILLSQINLHKAPTTLSNLRSALYCFSHGLSMCTGTPGGTHDIFGRGCATIKSLYRRWRKSWTLFGIFVPNGGLQSTMASIFKKFSKNCGFLVQTMSKKSINSVFFWFVICVIKITDPIWNFLDIVALFGIFVKNWHTLFGIFSWKCNPNAWHTPVYYSYGSPPPGGLGRQM